jgi:hypothetical protein
MTKKLRSNYGRCRAHLIEAFLSLDQETPEQDRLRRAIELLLEAVAQTEREARLSNVVRFPRLHPVMPEELPSRKPGV